MSGEGICARGERGAQQARAGVRAEKARRRKYAAEDTWRGADEHERIPWRWQDFEANETFLEPYFSL